MGADSEQIQVIYNKFMERKERVEQSKRLANTC